MTTLFYNNFIVINLLITLTAFGLWLHNYTSRRSKKNLRFQPQVFIICLLPYFNIIFLVLNVLTLFEKPKARVRRS